jgi:hypothetical protein
MYRKRMMNGTGGGKFTPNQAFTRAMAVTMLYRLAGEPAVRSDLAFADVDSAKWYGEAANWAAQSDIADADKDGNFRPNESISRQDLAVFISRYLTHIEADLAVTEQYITFSDETQIADYAKSAIQTLFKLGVLQGVGGNAIDPTGGTSRAEAAAMFDRLTKLL